MSNLHIFVHQIISGRLAGDGRCISHAVSARFRRAVKAHFPDAIIHIQIAVAHKGHALSVSTCGGGLSPEERRTLHANITNCLMSITTKPPTGVTKTIEAIQRQQLQNYHVQ